MPEQLVNRMLIVSVFDQRLLNKPQGVSLLALEHVRPTNLKLKKIIVGACGCHMLMKLANTIFSRNSVTDIAKPLLDNWIVFETVRALEKIIAAAATRREGSALKLRSETLSISLNLRLVVQFDLWTLYIDK